MKKNILYLLLICIYHDNAFGQQDTSLLYLKFPDVPPFTIIKMPDSTKFAKADLQKKKAVLLMIFSPDCEHCRHEIKEFIANIALFKNIEIVLVSHLDYRYTKLFYNQYHIGGYPGIIMGCEQNFFLSSFFGIKYLPAIFLYNNRGKFVNAFDGSVAVQKIAAAL